MLTCWVDAISSTVLYPIVGSTGPEQYVLPLMLCNSLLRSQRDCAPGLIKLDKCASVAASEREDVYHSPERDSVPQGSQRRSLRSVPAAHSSGSQRQ